MTYGYEQIAVWCPCGALLPCGPFPQPWTDAICVRQECGQTVRAQFWRRQATGDHTQELTIGGSHVHDITGAHI